MFDNEICCITSFITYPETETFSITRVQKKENCSVTLCSTLISYSYAGVFLTKNKHLTLELFSLLSCSSLILNHVAQFKF